VADDRTGDRVEKIDDESWLGKSTLLGPISISIPMPPGVKRPRPSPSGDAGGATGADTEKTA